MPGCGVVPRRLRGDLDRDRRIVERTVRGRGVSHDRHPGTRSLAQLHVLPDDRVEAQVFEELANVAQGLAGVAGPPVVERRKDPHFQIVADAAGNFHIEVQPIGIGTARLTAVEITGTRLGEATTETAARRRTTLATLRRALAGRDSAIVGLVRDRISPESYCLERAVR